VIVVIVEIMMVEATEIEKKSLEAHVELCAERYNALEDKMSTMAENISHLCVMVAEVKTSVTQMATKRNDQIISWGVGIIGFLTAIIGWFVMHYIVK